MHTLSGSACSLSTLSGPTIFDNPLAFCRCNKLSECRALSKLMLLYVCMYVCVSSAFGFLLLFWLPTHFILFSLYLILCTCNNWRFFISISCADHAEEKTLIWSRFATSVRAFLVFSFICTCLLISLFCIFFLLTTRSVLVCSAVLRFCTTVILLRTFIAYSLPASCLVNLRTKKTRPYAKGKSKRNKFISQDILCHFSRFFDAYRPCQAREWF